LTLPRVAKGRRARFHDDAAVDQLFGIVTALTAELSVAFERIETLERVLARRGSLERAEVEDYVIDEVEAGDRAAQREALIARVFQVLEAYGAPPGGRAD
jgi:predicted transcriptional regulator of viral defense system